MFPRIFVLNESMETVLENLKSQWEKTMEVQENSVDMYKKQRKLSTKPSTATWRQ